MLEKTKELIITRYASVFRHLADDNLELGLLYPPNFTPAAVEAFNTDYDSMYSNFVTAAKKSLGFDTSYEAKLKAVGMSLVK